MTPEVRQYATARSFAQALDHRLRSRSQERGGDVARWRRLVTFDRFLARLFDEPERVPWVVKGGYGLEVRYGMEARTTKDIDLSLAHRERDSREPLLQHFAEKIHAYVRPRASASTRVKDLVDLVLIAERGLPPATAVRHAVKGVFGGHPTSEVPQVFPGPPARWAIPYADLTRTVGVRAKTLEEANARLSEVWLALGLASEPTEG